MGLCKEPQSDFDESVGTLTLEKPNALNMDNSATSSVSIPEGPVDPFGREYPTTNVIWSNSAATQSFRAFSLRDESSTSRGVLDHTWESNYDPNSTAQDISVAFGGANLPPVPELARSTFPLIEQAAWRIPDDVLELYYKVRFDYMIEWTEGTSEFITYKTLQRTLGGSCAYVRRLDLAGGG